MPITKQPQVDLPVAGLEVGDSFFVPSIDPESTLRQCKALARRYRMCLSSRIGIDVATGCYGIRVWRTY